MSLSKLMVKGKSLDSHNEILKCINIIELQDHVYSRRGTCQKVKSYNNQKDVSLTLLIFLKMFQNNKSHAIGTHKTWPRSWVLQSQVRLPTQQFQQ
jgi:hypothetical protein